MYPFDHLNITATSLEPQFCSCTPFLSQWHRIQHHAPDLSDHSFRFVYHRINLEFSLLNLPVS